MEKSEFIEVYRDSLMVSRLLARVNPEEILAAELGQPFVEYRRRWERARNFLEIPAFPLQVDYELKYQCNLSCPICLMSLSKERRREFGQPDKELKIAEVREFISIGARKGQAAIGFGGLWEPLLSPDLPALVEHARSEGLVEAMFNTNGLLLTRETGRMLIEAGLTRLMISLDAASEEVYRLMRPGSDFHKVEENILDFMELRRSMGRRLPLVRVSFCLTSLNESEQEAFLERWQGRVDFFSIQSYGRFANDCRPLFPEKMGPRPEGRCAAPFKRLLVRHNGDVLPCCDVSGLGLSLGNVAEGLEEIWNGEKIKTLRRTQGYPGPCQKCQSKYEMESDGLQVKA